MIECISRAIITDGPFVLLTFPKSRAYSYLPGGHIEKGESAEQAVIRELKEEANIIGVVEKFLGIHEHFWHDATDKLTHEYNFMFQVRVDSLSAQKAPASCEEYIVFDWVHQDQLSSVKLYPHDLRTTLHTWLTKTGNLVTFTDMDKA